MNPIKIYWFAYFDISEPSVRYRGLYALQEAAATHNISYQIIYPGYRPATVYRFARAVLQVLLERPEGAVVIIEKLHTNRIYGRVLQLLQRYGKVQCLYDIDDADYLKFEPKTINKLMRNCRAVIAGSNAIANYARHMSGDVRILTSPIIAHKHVKQGRNKRMVIGWIGFYSAHKESLKELFFPGLADLGFDVVVRLLGVRTAGERAELGAQVHNMPHVHLETPLVTDWLDEEGIYKEIAQFDVGISPLLPTEINLAKSAFKTKQYLSCGVPVLGSGTGENGLFIKHGENGYECEDPKAYAERLTELQHMKEEAYAAMSEKARASVTDFAMSSYCSDLLDIVKSVIKEKKKS